MKRRKDSVFFFLHPSQYQLSINLKSMVGLAFLFMFSSVTLLSAEPYIECGEPFAGPEYSSTCMRKMSDGGYLIGGYLDKKPFITRVTTTNDSVWTKTFSDSGRVYEIHPLANNEAIVWYTKDNFKKSLDDEQEKTFMAQLNANGEPVWEKTIFDAPAKGVSAIPLKDGGYSVCFYKVTYDDYINKIDTNFVIIYNTQFEPVRTKRMKHFRFSKHIQTSDGGFLLIGSGKQQISLIGDVYTKKIMKLSADLDSLWAREITPDNSSHELGGAYHLSELPDGSFNVMMVANDTTSKKGLLFCARLSSDGIKQWEKTYPGFVSFDAIINSGSYPIAIEFPDFGVGFVTPIMHWDPYQYYGMYYRFNHDMDTIWKFKSMDHIEYNNGLALGNNSAILLKTDRTLCTIGYGTQPSVTITQPETGESFGVGEPVTIVAEVHNDSAKYVDYFSGTTLIGTDSTAPYSFSWTDAEPGIHNLTAVATCTSGVSVTSPVIIIAVSSVAVTNTLARFGPNKGLKIIPGNREITFSTHTINTHHIEVVTINGRCIRRYKGKGVQSHSAKLPAGMYFIRYTVSDNSVIHPVVVK